MTLLLLLALSPNAFFREAVPALARMASGPMLMLDSQHQLTFGAEANLVRFHLYPGSASNNVPAASLYYGYSFNNPLRSCLFLRGGLWPRNENTAGTTQLLGAGFGLAPPNLDGLSFRVTYATASATEFYPGDPYFNYRLDQLHALGVDAAFARSFGRFLCQVAAGGSVAYSSGLFRQDVGEIAQPYSGLAPGWNIEAAVQFSVVRVNAGLGNGRVQVGLGVQVTL